MKKLLTFLFALMLISVYTFGQGNYFVWTGAAGDGNWQNSLNWTAPAALPYGEIGGTSTWPGQNANGDYAVFNTGFIETVVNVPTMTLGRLEITFLPTTTNPTDVTLLGASDGVVMTMRTPSPEIIAEATFWIVKIEEFSNLRLDQPGARIKMVCEPRAHFWQKNGSTFFPAQYLLCDGDKGFVLEATASLHAEYIQQELCSQNIKGWVQYVFDDNKHHYFSAPITSVWPAVGDPEFSNSFCRKHNTLCVFDGDYVRKYINGSNWDNWLGPCGPIVLNPVINFEAGKGYHYYGNALNNPGGLYEVYGTFNSQFLGNPVNLPVTALGWNFVGNPFPSTITFGEPSGAPTAGVGWTWDLTLNDPIAYYWDNSLNAGLGGYHFYNWYTGVGNGFVDERRLLARGQGFFVHNVNYNPPASDIKVGNLARVFRGVFQIGKSEVANNLFLTLNDASGNSLDDAIIGFRDDATGAEYNRLLDANKFFNEIANISQLYMKSTDDVLLASKTLKLASGKVMFPVYMKVINTGTYSIEAKDINTFPANTAITLVDTKTNTEVDLRTNPVYTFTATAGDDDARFNIYFKDVLGINNVTDNSFSIYSYNNAIFIQNNDLKKASGSVQVYDMIGKQMMQQDLGGAAITRISTSLNTGFYIVSVTTDKGVYTQKVYIN